MNRHLLNLSWLALVLVTCGQTEEPPLETTLVKIGELPPELVEISGMTEYDGLLWGINDSGNEPVLFGFNSTTLQTEKKVVTGAPNTDWEELAQDGDHFYIGDFGNNLGNRKDLSIYIIDKSDLASGKDTVNPSGMIRFTYEDQVDFSPAAEFNTPYDCEAFVVAGDSVLLFTKDWVTEHTTVYVIPSAPGSYTARIRYRANVGGLVTAADWDPESRELLLLGYADFSPFLLSVTGFDPAEPVFKKSRKVPFSEFFGAQTEAICRAADGSVLVSCEQSALVKSTLYRAQY
jgi:hypothetical protein